jgi:flagellar motor switch protein FliN
MSSERLPTEPPAMPAAAAADAVRAVSYDALQPESVVGSSANDIELVLDVPVQMTVELGRVRMSIRQLLALGPGAVVALDRQSGEALDVLINGCLVAQGDVVVVNDRYAIRLTEIVTPAERMRRLNR